MKNKLGIEIEPGMLITFDFPIAAWTSGSSDVMRININVAEIMFCVSSQLYKNEPNQEELIILHPTHGLLYIRRYEVSHYLRIVK